MRKQISSIRCPLCVLLTVSFAACSTINTDSAFADTDIQSIDLVAIEHPMLGGIAVEKSLSNDEMVSFLSDLRTIRKEGVLICRAKHIIRLNFQTDTLRLKVYDACISNRVKEVYYSFDTGEEIIQKCWSR